MGLQAFRLVFCFSDGCPQDFDCVGCSIVFLCDALRMFRVSEVLLRYVGTVSSCGFRACRKVFMGCLRIVFIKSFEVWLWVYDGIRFKFGGIG